MKQLHKIITEVEQSMSHELFTIDHNHWLQMQFLYDFQHSLPNRQWGFSNLTTYRVYWRLLSYLHALAASMELYSLVVGLLDADFSAASF